MSLPSMRGLKISVQGHLRHARMMYEKRPEHNGYWYLLMRKYENAWEVIQDYEERANELH